jgi:tripartite-type tricarboxylate transporter receptor subunit TctC
MTPQQFTSYIDKDVTKWKRVVKERGIQVDGA